MRSLRFIRIALLLWLSSLPLTIGAQSPASPSPGAARDLPTLSLETGREIFDGACIGCHGPGGTGQPLSILGFDPPDTFPDFSDCNGSTRERRADWRAIIRDGGSRRGFSEIMPAFGDALTLEQIDKVTAYLREQCPDPAWPPGEMNLPRALFTEKAFPEDEWVVTTAANANRGGEVGSRIIYEKRFGARNQIEIVVPFGFVHGSVEWLGGVGDVVGGYKRVLVSRPASGTLFSVAGEAVIPTGHETRGLGAGTPIVEVFGAFGQVLPRAVFVGDHLIEDPAPITRDSSSQCRAVATVCGRAPPPAL